MSRVLRSGRQREVWLVAAWAIVFLGLLAARVALQRVHAPPAPHAFRWLRLGAVILLAILFVAAAVSRWQPLVGRVVLRVEQGAVFLAITRLLGLGSQPDPQRPEQVLIALLGVHAVGAIVVSDELPSGTPVWRAGLWTLALSFGALTATVLGR